MILSLWRVGPSLLDGLAGCVIVDICFVLWSCTCTCGDGRWYLGYYWFGDDWLVFEEQTDWWSVFQKFTAFQFRECYGEVNIFYTFVEVEHLSKWTSRQCLFLFFL